MPSRKLRGASKKCATFLNILRRSERLRERRFQNRYPTTRKKIGPYRAILGLWGCGWIYSSELFRHWMDIQVRRWILKIFAIIMPTLLNILNIVRNCQMKMRMICIRIGTSCEYLKYCKWEWEWFAFRSAFAIGNINNSANANENDSHSAEGGAGGRGG